MSATPLTGKAKANHGQKTPDIFNLWISSGGAEQNRTVDLLNAIQALSQLSYDPIQWIPRCRHGSVGRCRNHEGWIDARRRSVKRNARRKIGNHANPNIRWLNAAYGARGWPER